MAASDWQVGPVLKDKIGSQGTLFRGGTKYSSDKRYPRGYTPERQAEVQSAIKPSGYTTDDPVDALRQHSRLTDTVARSTAPVSHLQGVQWAHTRPGEAITAGDGAAGAYFAGRETHPDSAARKKGVVKSEALIAVKPEYDRTPTVLHELGHHVSHEMEQTEHSQPGAYSYTSGHGGAEEAFADNYAETHFRDRKGRPVSRGTYGGGQFAGRIERSDEFWNGYRANRHYMPDKKFDKDNARYFHAFPEEQVHPDQSQDVPLIHREREYGGYTDKGQEVSDRLGDVNEDAIPSHTNFEWSKYRV